MRALILAIGMMIAAGPSMAAFSGLLIIPTAETVGDNRYELQPQIGGSARSATSSVQFINSEFGFGDRIEAGIDLGTGWSSERTALGNAKYVFAVDTKRDFRLAVGIFNSLFVSRNTPYIVATKPLGGRHRLHLGFQRQQHLNEWFVGVDQAVGHNLVFMADYTSGPGNVTSAGFTLQLNRNLGVQFGILFPNDGDDTLYLASLNIGGRIRPQREVTGP